LLGFLICCSSHADVKLPEIFADHMVLQRDTSVPVWGWADPGESVTVAAANDNFVWASATIEPPTGSGQAIDTVVVTADTVPNPVAVRYAWADDPACNLYNKEGLPAAPFRTDTLPLAK
jgi:hypothetical protein